VQRRDEAGIDTGTFTAALAAARAGAADDLGRLLMQSRDYLLLVADRELGNDLKGQMPDDPDQFCAT
jgi:hypothetical protein